MSEDEELKRKIANLQGRIDRHKQQQSASNTRSYGGVHKWSPHRGTPYGVRGRGHGGRYAPSGYRNRTLVLNNSNASTPSAESGPDADVAADPAAQPQWVSVQGGHNKQLINASVYEKVSQQKIKDMQESLAAKQKARDEKERARLERHFASQSSGAGPVAAGSASNVCEIDVNGVRFRVIDGGSKLIRVSDDPNTVRLIPRQTKVAGVTFLRSKHGNLYRYGLIKPKKSKLQKSNRLCPAFTSTGTFYKFDPPLGHGRSRLRDQCLEQLTDFAGTCSKGPNCRFTHDPDNVAICKEFLQKGTCAAGDNCDLSHDPTPHRVPACVHFLRGGCTKDDCRYAHVKVSANAPVCRAFAQLGFCDRGSACDERHVTECPDYANKGFCHNSSCRLPHVDRAGQLRKAASAREKLTPEEDDTPDLSSDEESYSDDIDSDEDIVITGVEGAGQEVSENQDFIHF